MQRLMCLNKFVCMFCTDSAYRLPSGWNVMPFCPAYDAAMHETAVDAFVGIIHFTCTVKQHIYSSMASFGRWAWLVQFYADMRWEWLNEGRSDLNIFERQPIHVGNMSLQARVL